jgi:hypothetical protein
MGYLSISPVRINVVGQPILWVSGEAISRDFFDVEFKHAIAVYY